MVVIIVILVFVSILSGMALSIWAFGTGSKRAKIFEDIYFSVEDVENKGIIYTKKGDYSAVLEMENPIKKYSADTDSYYDFTTLMASYRCLERAMPCTSRTFLSERTLI